MSARTKLNGMIIGGVLLFAALLGGIGQSWLIFVAVMIIGTMLVVHAGEVRLAKSDREFVLKSGRRKWKRG